MAVESHDRDLKDLLTQVGKGDLFYMLRVGGDNDGIVFQGDFISEPYEDKDWAGTTKKRHYVDIGCYNLAEPRACHCCQLRNLRLPFPK